MVRDITRAALLVAVMAVGSSLLIETRYQLVCVDAAHRQLLAGQPVYATPQYQNQPQPEPGRLRRFGRSALDLADAALGIVR